MQSTAANTSGDELFLLLARGCPEEVLNAIRAEVARRSDVGTRAFWTQSMIRTVNIGLDVLDAFSIAISKEALSRLFWMADNFLSKAHPESDRQRDACSSLRDWVASGRGSHRNETILYALTLPREIAPLAP